MDVAAVVGAGTTRRWPARAMAARTRRRGRGRTRSCRGRMRRRPRRRPSRAPRRAAAGRPPPTARMTPSASRRTSGVRRPSRACAGTRRLLDTVAGATRPPPPVTAAASSPPGIGRDRRQISAGQGRRRWGAARRGGIASMPPLVEMTFPEATLNDDVDADANYIRRSLLVYPSIEEMWITARSNLH